MTERPAKRSKNKQADIEIVRAIYVSPPTETVHTQRHGRAGMLWAMARPYYVWALRGLLGTRLRMYATFCAALLLMVALAVWTSGLLVPSAARLAELSEVMIVPKEQPEIATIVDAQALRAQQPFYADVAEGDMLFLFPLAGKAVLYRPQTHQIVNAGPVSMPAK